MVINDLTGSTRILTALTMYVALDLCPGVRVHGPSNMGWKPQRVVSWGATRHWVLRAMGAVRRASRRFSTPAHRDRMDLLRLRRMEAAAVCVS